MFRFSVGRINRNSSKSAKALSAKGTGKAGGCFIIVFFSIFAVFGFAFLYWIAIGPLIRIQQARNWESTPCVVNSSSVTESTDSEGSTTYAVAVSFSYEYKGRDYTGNRYSFFTGSSSGYEGKAKIVRQLPPGKETICYVNPQDPYKSVLNRGVTGQIWFGLIPLIFIAVGVGGIVWSVRAMIRLRRGVALSTSLTNAGAASFKASSKASDCVPRPPKLPGEMKLKSKWNPIARFIGMTVFSLLWCGIAAFAITKGWNEGLGPKVILSIFAIAGIVIVAMTIRAALQTANPRVSLSLEPGAIRLGEASKLRWSLTGAVGNVQRLTLTLEGIEEATYTRGTDTYTDKETFYKQVIADAQNRRGIQIGAADIAIPREAIHTFRSRRNKVRWVLQVKGVIDNWPDIENSYEIDVLPARDAGMIFA